MVEQRIPLLDGVQVLRVLLVGPRGLYDASHLVDLGVDATRGDEVRELPCVVGRCAWRWGEKEGG